jgi:hypothetical protein
LGRRGIFEETKGGGQARNGLKNGKDKVGNGSSDKLGTAGTKNGSSVEESKETIDNLSNAAQAAQAKRQKSGTKKVSRKCAHTS